MRIRVTRLRTGGGTAGNLPPGSLTEISARDLEEQPVSGLKVVQSLPTEGGDDAETLPAVERRIPAFLRHRDRTVTAADYRHLAAETPGVRLGRIEILPRFKPQQRQFNVPGVVSVMVLPQGEPADPPNPRPDRPMIERVFAYLDPRRPIGTELYVIGCEYIPLAVSVGVTIHDGFDGGAGGLNRDGVLREINQAVRRYLWPLLPGGPDGGGWPLGRAVRNRELEAVAARVPGVEEVRGINLFSRENGDWTRVTTQPGLVAQVTLTAWQLPELLDITVAEGPPADELDTAYHLAPETGMAIPVVPEVC
jgi:predicted phage baseplate assembly protein